MNRRETVRVYIGIGSNTDREHHLRAGLNALRQHFGELIVSPVYESDAVGFDGDPFLNLVVGVETGMPVAELSRCLKAIEVANGRLPSTRGYSPRTLDLDVLTYGTLDRPQDGVDIPRTEILTNAFVLGPLADIAGDEQHPVDGRTYRELWRRYDGSQQIHPVAFHWHA